MNRNTEQKKPRVLSAELHHESKTSSRIPTGLTDFEKEFILYGEDAIEARGNANTELAGVLEVSKSNNWHHDHILSAKAGPGGIVTDEAFNALCAPIIGAIQDAIDENQPYDGIVLNLHGAMVTNSYDDAEGELLKRIRNIAGEDVSIAITLDPHANVSEEMCTHADIVLAYKTYPHIDMRETGYQAAEILDQAISGDIKPVTLRVPVAMMEEANSGRTDVGPMIERIDALRKYEELSAVSAASVIAGFPANVPFVGPSVLVTYDALSGDAQPHIEFATEIAADIWDKRNDVLNTYYSVEDASAQASVYDRNDHDGKPLIIADFADNPGAGGYGDSTALLDALLQAEISDVCVGPMVDVEIATLMQDKKVGETFKINLGGKTDESLGGGPIPVTAELIWAGDGNVTGDGPMLNGLEKDFGATAVLRIEGIDVLVVTNAHQMLDLQQFKTFGINPEDYNVVALKSEQHFRAAFGPISGSIIVCDGGGLSSTKREKNKYPKVPEETFPFGDKIEGKTYDAETVTGRFTHAMDNAGGNNTSRGSALPKDVKPAITPEPS